MLKALLLIFVGAAILALLGIAARAQDTSPRITPAEAAAKVAAGEALLIDVREPAEWSETGVAAPALLLSLSDLRGDRDKWSAVLAEAKANATPLLLYCRSGNRSGQAAALLAKEGFQVANVGGFRDWQAARLPTRQASEPRVLP